MLLIFNIGFIIKRIISSPKNPSVPHNFPPHPTTIPIIIFVLLLAGVSYLHRIEFTIANLFIAFPCFGYFPQYLTFFILGTIAFHRN